jgi:hypothetical protein
MARKNSIKNCPVSVRHKSARYGDGDKDIDMSGTVYSATQMHAMEHRHNRRVQKAMYHNLWPTVVYRGLNTK